MQNREPVSRFFGYLNSLVETLELPAQQQVNNSHISGSRNGGFNDIFSMRERDRIPAGTQPGDAKNFLL